MSTAKKTKVGEDKDTVNEEDFSKMDLSKWMGLLSNYQKLDTIIHPKEKFIQKDHSDVDSPLMFIFTADWHLGSKSCDYNKWQEDISFLLGLPSNKVRVVLMGDLIDNVFPTFKNAQSVFGYLRPELQKEFLKTLLTKMKPFLECACWGNHDIEWDEKKTGYSDVAIMLKDACSYFESKGYLEVLLGSQRYTFMLSHNLKGHSWFHSMHGNIRAWLDSRTDVVVGAHIHSPGYLSDYYGTDEHGNRKQRHLIQVGSYKNIGDIYSDRNFNTGLSELPTLVLYPDKHKILHFSDLKDAAKWMGIKSKKILTLGLK